MTIVSEIKHIIVLKNASALILEKITTTVKDDLATGMSFRSGLMKDVSVYSPKRGAFSELADEVNSNVNFEAD